MPPPTDNDGPLIQLRAYLAQRDSAPGTKLPPERALSGILGVTRGDLRKALAVLEAEGQVWRHVGKGTFIGARPRDDLAGLADIRQRTNPAEVMRTRLLLEPPIAREAAINASEADVEAMRRCMATSRAARTWRHYETCDNELHQLIAEASHNRLLLSLFDILNTVRRTVVWARLRDATQMPPPDHHSFDEHEAIVAAIAERDLEGAARAMTAHLRTVEQYLIAWRDAAE